MTVLHQTDGVRIDSTVGSSHPTPVAASPLGHTLRDLRVAAANQLELWAAGQVCDGFRRDYLVELVNDLRANALDVPANQLDLWSAGKVCDEQRRESVLALVAELRAAA